MPFTDLKQELDRLTSRIWWDVTTVRAAQGPWKLGEVSVTERLHLDLLNSGLMDGMVQYNVPHEPTTGADWEWLVQVPDTQNFLRYRIQAKILDAVGSGKPPALRFSKINYRKQRANLIARSQADNALPFYAFYVGNPWPNVVPVMLPPWRAIMGVSEENFGCTAVPAEVVNRVYSGAVRSKSEATQYLMQNSGRRLSDLFPDTWGSTSSPGSNGGGGRPPGAGNSPNAGSGQGPDVGPPRIENEGTALSAREASWLAQLKERAAPQERAILTGQRDDNLRATLFFTAR